MKQDRELIKKRIEDFYDGDVRDYHLRNYIASGRYSSLKYRQFYIENIIAKQSLPKKTRILDVGCGPGELILSLLAKGYNVWGVDISRRMIDEASETIRKNGFPEWDQASVGDIEELHFGDGWFDVVVASGVIEYQKEDQSSLREMNRVLKSGGFLILNVTNKYSYVSVLDGAYIRIKRNRMTRWLLDLAKSKILRKGKISDRRFHPDRRIHSPKAFDREIADAGFAKVSHNYFHFGLLPKPLDSFFWFINEPVARKMEATLTQSRFGVIGGGYIVLARKVANIEGT